MDKHTFKAGDIVRRVDLTDPYYAELHNKDLVVDEVRNDMLWVAPVDEPRRVSGGHGHWRFKHKRGNDTFIIVVKDSNGNLKPASTPQVLTSEAQAKLVASSMAEKHPGQEFLIFKAVGQAKVNAATVVMF